MKYVSLDLETTGLDPSHNQIIEIGAVIDDLSVRAPLSELPTFRRLVKHDWYVFDHDIFRLFPKHTDIIREMDDPANQQIVGSIKVVRGEFHCWLIDNDYTSKSTVFAGKNFATFDLAFLKAAKFDQLIKISHRCIDVGPMCIPFIKPEDIGKYNKPPTMDECLSIMGITPFETQHRALPDAITVVKLIRAAYGYLYNRT